MLLIITHIRIIQFNLLRLDGLAHQPAHEAQPDKQRRFDNHFTEVQPRISDHNEPGHLTIALDPGLQAQLEQVVKADAPFHGRAQVRAVDHCMGHHGKGAGLRFTALPKPQELILSLSHDQQHHPDEGIPLDGSIRIIQHLPGNITLVQNLGNAGTGAGRALQQLHHPINIDRSAMVHRPPPSHLRGTFG